MIEFARLRAKMIIVNIKKLKEQKSVQSKEDLCLKTVQIACLMIRLY